MAGKRFILGFILSLALVFFSWPGARTAQASCGAVYVFCRHRISAASVRKRASSRSMRFTITRRCDVLDGTNGVIPGVDQTIGR